MCSDNTFKVDTPSASTVKTLSVQNSSTVSAPRSNKASVACPICKNPHRILQCSKFLSAKISERYEILKKFQRCFSCAGAHLLLECGSRGACQICQSKKHNTLLHSSSDTTPKKGDFSDLREKDVTTPSSISSGETSEEQSLSARLNNNTHVLLSTAHAKIRSSSGDWVTCRLLVDSGSQSHFITKNLADRLKLARQRITSTVSGVGNTTLPQSQYEVACQIRPVDHVEVAFSFTARVLPKIVSSVPSLPVSEKVRHRFSSLPLADANFHTPGQIDLLVGAQIYSEILSDPPLLIKGRPSAIHTALGWIVFGDTDSEGRSDTNPLQSFFAVSSIQDNLQRFWETEEVEVRIPEDPTHQISEQHFKENVQQDDQGRFVVSLPFRQDVSHYLKSTREIALKRLYSLEKRFVRDPLYHSLYNAQMKGYIESDHVRRTKSNSDYVLTHHGVSKASSTTSLRIVFNGSEREIGFSSLNDLLLPGKPLQPDIGHIIDQFRLFPFAISCDVKQMFRSIRLSPSDQHLVHFLWRFHSSDPIYEYELTTLPFGLKSSPFLAQRVLIELFSKYGDQFPLASRCISDIYVDNVVTGAFSFVEAVQLCEEIKQLFVLGGFQLHKFACNDSRVLSSVPEEHRDKSLPFEDSSSFKILGLQWNANTDCLGYKVDVSTPVFTKRGILSTAARIFDVNGYVSPVTFWIKSFLQRLWLIKLDWDDELPSNLIADWSRFLEELPRLHDIAIPRFMSHSEISSSTLVAFSDASERGFGCVIYFIVDREEQRFVHLLKAKSKVASLKTLSIPRLELSAALLSAKVIRSLSSFIEKGRVDKIYCFSDSKNVLWWLQTPSYLLKTYVANRVVQILECTKPSCWNYVATHLNPADCVSRGLTPEQLIEHSLYWQGPDFLKLPDAKWPLSPLDPRSDVLELKTVSMISQENSNSLLEHFNKTTSFLHLKRVMAFILKFCNSFKSQVSPSNPTEVTHSLLLSAIELDTALVVYIKLLQAENFSSLMADLRNHRQIKGSLRKLSPIIAEDGLIRVGGRLINSSLPDNSKHPILIPKESHLATLLVDHYHLYSLHGGTQLVQGLIQRRFWIPALRVLVRRQIFKCVVCYKFKAKPQNQMMAPLPSMRVNQVRAFYEVGVDYGGPFLYKESKRRNARKYKCWICLFVCMATKAVHLELVSDLTTVGFLAALDRFIARRGLPRCIHSDNGTNFVGATRLLKEIYDFLSKNVSSISDHLSAQNIQWCFIPPTTPHFGGLWEAAIKSVKNHLSRVIQQQAFTFEEFASLLTRIESILNSRPLCSISNDPHDDPDCLTPGHFLIGQPLLTRPEGESAALSFPINTRWELVQRSVRHFWKRWHLEYLHTLLPRKKWWTSSSNLSDGMIVVIKEKDSPPQQWTMARILQTFPGPDGVVRVAKVKTPSTVLVRPVHNLIPLPVGVRH